MRWHDLHPIRAAVRVKAPYYKPTWTWGRGSTKYWSFTETMTKMTLKNINNFFIFKYINFSTLRWNRIKEINRSKKLELFLSSAVSLSLENLDKSFSVAMTHSFSIQQTGWERRKRRNWQSGEAIRRAGREAEREHTTGLKGGWKGMSEEESSIKRGN